MTDTAKPTKGPILRGDYDEYLGYDRMTGGVKIGPVYLDGARIRWIQYALITLGIAAYGFGAWVLMEWLFPL